MALTESAKTSFAFKKLLGRDYTFPGDPRQWYGEDPGGGFNVSYAYVWGEDVPSTAPGSTTSVVKCWVDGIDGALKLTQDTGVPNERGWYAFSGSRLKNWIPPKYDSTVPSSYEVALYEDDGTGLAKGTKIVSSDAMDWLFDYETGVLAIQDTHSYTTPFWIEGYQYIGDMLDTVIGGLGSGNAIYIEEASTPQWNTSAGDGYLNFGSQFSLTTALGNSSTITLANGLILNGGITVNGGINVSGNLTVSGATSLNGGLTVSGTTTLDGATTINDTLHVSGSITIGASARIEATAAGTITTNANISPTADTTISLGTSSERFSSVYTQQVYFNTNAYMSATSAGTIRVRGSFTPTADNTQQVGDATYRWGAIYANSLFLHQSVTAAFADDGVGTYITQYRSMVPSVNNSYSLGTSTLSYDDIWGYEFYCREFIEFTAATSHPATPANGIRLYAQVTGSLTKLMYKDSAGTTYQLPGAGGSGNALYVEEGANPEWNTSGADGYLNFDSSDFLLTTNGQSSTVSLASGLVLDGGITVNGGAFVSGTMTVEGSIVPDIDSTYDVGAYGVSGSGPMWRYIFLSEGIWGKNDARLSFTGSSTVIVPSGNTFEVPSYMCVGNTATPQSTRAFKSDNTFTSPTATDAGVYSLARFAPSVTATSSIFKTGVDGFAQLENTNCTCNFAGLRFGPYVSGTIAGHTAHTTTYGIYTWAARGFGCEFRAANAYGLFIKPWFNDFAGEVYVTNMYGMYIDDSSALNGSGTITNNYGQYIAAQTRGTNKYQLVLAGSGTAGSTSSGHGIWLGGTSGKAIGTNGTNLWIHGLNAGTGTNYVKWNSTGKLITYQSSRRADKEGIKDFRDDWYNILDARPRSFTFKNEGIPCIGYIAEEFEDIGLNNLVSHDENGEPINIEYDKIAIYLKEIVYEQQKTIENLENRLAALEKTMGGK